MQTAAHGLKERFHDEARANGGGSISLCAGGPDQEGGRGKMYLWGHHAGLERSGSDGVVHECAHIPSNG
eukprot:1700422-Pleurochrysis_carterae.AAC.1